MLNLLDNAAKWSPPGGRVGVRLRTGRPVHAELVVSDHGPGIPPHERRLVFERFYRSTSARAMPGSGLGLAIVKQVVLKHGGDASHRRDASPAASRRARRFYVLLPGARSRRRPGDTRPRSRELAGGQRRAMGELGRPLAEAVWACPEGSLSGFSARSGNREGATSLYDSCRTSTDSRKSTAAHMTNHPRYSPPPPPGPAAGAARARGAGISRPAAPATVPAAALRLALRDPAAAAYRTTP